MQLRKDTIMNINYGKTDCKAEETGFDSSRLIALNNHFQRMIDKEVIWGASYCISHKGKIIANAALGACDAYNAGTKMQPDTVFAIASITKTFTAIPIMQLVEDGFLRLDDDVSNFLPQFEKKPFDTIKVYHLLTHTSGIYPDGGCFPDVYPNDCWGLIDEAVKAGKKDIDWIERGISAGLKEKPGTSWMYCSFGFALLGQIIATITGQSAESYIQSHILAPLGMNDSGFFATKANAHRAFAYDKGYKEYLDKISSGTDPMSLNEDIGTVWEQVPGTAGQMVSTPVDLIRYANALLNKGRLDGARIIGRKTLEKMTTNHLFGVPDHCWGANEPNRLYGIGFDMREGMAYTYSHGTFMHEGAGASSIDIDPVEQLAAAWFVPFNKPKNGWTGDVLYNVQNIIWSGLI